MIDEGVLTVTGNRPIAAYALHVTSAKFEPGVFAARTGPMMAASDVLSVTVRGAGGHGSVPHLAQDPIPVACEMALAIQTVVTRTFDVFDPVVVTVGTFHAGTKENVIPASAAFTATIRSFSVVNRSKLYEVLPRLIAGIAEGHGLSADVELTQQYPVMNNHGPETEFLAETVRDLFGADRYRTMSAPLTSSEDFSRVLDEVPGAYAMVGACPNGTNPATAAYNHAPDAEFDESVMLRGAELFVELAIRRLARTPRIDHPSVVQQEEGHAPAGIY
jgi:hippurate hydrolase